MTGLELLRLSHALAGAVALSSLGVPLATKKGGRVHRRAGWVFVVAMSFVAVSAATMAVLWFASGDPAVETKAWFFGFLAILTGEAIFYGLRVLRQKRRVDRHRSGVDYGASALLVVASVTMMAKSLVGGGVLFGFFGLLGLALGAGQLTTMLRAPKFKQFWWNEHLAAMATAGIAAVTAFLVVNVHHVPAVPPLLAWIAPGVIGGVAIGVSSSRYERRFTEDSRIGRS